MINLNFLNINCVINVRKLFECIFDCTLKKHFLFVTMNIKPNIIKDIDMEWLKRTAEEITKGKTTLQKKCHEAKFYINQKIPITYSISENSLRRLFRHYNISYTAKKRTK